MSRVRYLLVIFLVVMSSACSDNRHGQSAKTLADNQDNRTVVAKKYLELMPPKDLLHAVASRIAPNLPEKDRKAFIEIMQSPGIEKEAYRITLASLVKNFTLGELNAMVTFYGSPEGQSAVKKFTPLMAEVMPQIQQEVKKALAQTQQEPESKEVPKAQGQAKPPNPKEQGQAKQPNPKEQKALPGKQ